MISVTRTTPENSYNRLTLYTGTPGNVWSAWVGFSSPIEEVKITAKDYGALFEFSADGVIPYGTVHVEADMLITIPLRCWYYRVQSMVVDENGTYKLEAYWNYF